MRQLFEFDLNMMKKKTYEKSSACLSVRLLWDDLELSLKVSNHSNNIKIAPQRSYISKKYGFAKLSELLVWNIRYLVMTYVQGETRKFTI